MTEILAGKVTRNCRTDEVSTPVIALVAKCAKGIQFNWVHYLFIDFLAKFHKMQDHSKTFHHAWLLFSIVLVAWELPKDSQFPMITPDLAEAVKFASLWVAKDPQQVKDSNISCILMEIIIHMDINCKSQLSPKNFDKLQEYVEFKANFHHVSIRA